MKTKKNFVWKRALACLMAVVTILGMVPQMAVSAAGNTVTMSFDYCYDSSGNVICYAADLVWNGSTIGESGDAKYMIYGDGEEAYCIQPGVSLHSGNTLTKDASDTWNALTANQQNAIKLALTYGRPGNSSNLSGTAGEQYVATQAIVWEIVKGCRNSTGTYKRVDNTFYNSFFANGANSGVLKVYEEIEAAMAEYNTIPSFMSGTKSSADTYQMEWDGSSYSVTLTDSNKCLSNYSFTSSDSSVKISVSGNKLTLTSSSQITSAVTITATGSLPTLSSSAKLVAYGDTSLQDVLIGVELPDTIKAYAKVETAVGSLKLVKTSEDGEVSGITFHISGNGLEMDVVTGTDGTITTDNIPVGTYTVTETAADYYETPSSQSVTIASGKRATVTFSNVLKRGSLEVTKTSEDGLVEGITFHLYGTSKSGLAVDEYAVTNADGVATFSDVLISGSGGYTLEEVDTKEYYIVPETQTAVIEWNTVTEKTVENVLKRGDLTVTKSSEDGLNSGIQFVLYGTSLSGESVRVYATTDENGVATFSDVLISNADGYTLEEVDTAAKYVVPESQVLPVYWNEVTETTVTNILKKFRVKVVKTDSETGTTPQGDASLAGAVYGIYENGELVDTYTTDSNGEFVTSYYICGDNWTVQEITPPEGYVLDETVYKVGASAEDYTIELNTTENDVTDDVIKGSIQIVKHTDEEDETVTYETESEESDEAAETETAADETDADETESEADETEAVETETDETEAVETESEADAALDVID